MSDSLVSGDISNWNFYGDAISERAPYNYNEDSKGLQIGVQSLQNKTWAGFFAESKVSQAYLYHAVLSIPNATIQYGSFNTGLYVQTAGEPLVNYVTCAATVNSMGHFWSVVLATGSHNAASKFTQLWKDESKNQPLSRDCAIITNGLTIMKIYLDHELVYSNNNMALDMPAPFNSFLEVQTLSNQMVFGKYSDYYEAKSDTIAITGLPANSTVQILDSANNTLASSSANDNGVVRIDVGKYHMPIEQADIQVYTQDKMIATSGKMSLWGGDEYSIQDDKSVWNMSQ